MNSVVQKLIDALYMENIYNFRKRSFYRAPYLIISISKNEKIMVLCKKRKSLRPYCITENPTIFLLEKLDKTEEITEDEWFNSLIQASWFSIHNKPSILALWLESKANADRLNYSSRTESILQSRSFQQADTEWISLLSDRPFHPFAYAKGGLNELLQDNKRGKLLYWWAFPADQMLCGGVSTILDFIDIDKKTNIINALNGLPVPCIPLPLLACEHDNLTKVQQNTFLYLDVETYFGPPTGSLRTLIANSDPSLHLKLSSLSSTLGAKRTMPPRYLKNGDKAYDLMNKIIESNHLLTESVFLCDESHWWVTKDADTLIKSEGTYGCQIRYLPSYLIKDCKLIISFSALNAVSVQEFSRYFQSLDQFIKQLINDFITTFLTLWLEGVMPECHGQNVLLLIFPDGRLGFLLRDHDTLRINPLQLERRGFDVPQYDIDKDSSNNLILDNRVTLLDYFMTLGLQVNLYPVVMHLVGDTEKNESDFWQQVSESVNDAIASLDDPTQAALINDHLLTPDTWPFKSILQPLFQQVQATSGMPSSMTRIENPLKLFNQC